MQSGLLIIAALLGVLVVLALGGIVLLRRSAATEVLRERLLARESELERLQGRIDDMTAQLEAQREANAGLRDEKTQLQTRLEEERNQQRDKLTLLQNAREQMTLEFKNLANEILDQKGKAFSDLSKRNLQDILKPLGEKIQLFEKKVEDSYNQEAKERFSLAREIKTLQELNTRISEDAVNLTNALKGESKTQGIWGEVILERVLEKSGLMRGREYEVQVSLRGEDGRARQPDVIVHLPENKDVIIDAKVSLKAYEQYCSEDDETRRAECLKLHIQSIRGHIKSLSDKDYHNLEAVRSLDFVMLFLPVEAAFSLAVQQDDNLFAEAFDRNIMLVGPSTLLATLRTIQNIWRYEYQNKNALEIARQAGNLYDKFKAFTDDLDEIGKRLGQTQQSWDKAWNKLCSGKGNLVARVERLKALGAKASKQLDRNLLEDDSGEEPQALLEDLAEEAAEEKGSP